MKKLLLALCVVSSMSQAMENGSLAWLAETNVNEPRMLGLKICPKWQTINEAGCQHCAAACVCCTYLAFGSGLYIYQAIRNKIAPQQPTARHME